MVSISPELSLYFHVPFCQKKCDYCHFYVLRHREEARKRFLSALEKEWELRAESLEGARIVSIYFGGGTPSLLLPSELRRILDGVYSHPHVTVDPKVEVTLEANPETVTLPRFQQFVAAGVNRVSVGVQVLDDHLLRRIGRQHSAERALAALNQLYEAGVSNVSVDLMYDLPGQTVEVWQRTLQGVLEAPITHLSLYNLVIEPRSVFFAQRSRIEMQMPGEEDSALMLQAAVEVLPAKGFHRYEVSAFARPGFESVHNVGYWTARSFLGLGPSAFSYWEGKRFRNVESLGRYCQALDEGLSPVDFWDELEPAARLRELLCVALRLCRGVNLKDFCKEQGKVDFLCIQTLEDLARDGLLSKEGETWRLSEQGLRFYDSVASCLI